mmetsp:Transcript_26548/g.68417  ORF Transcript_26548/g.68417 Transcript_26548/m.68417 type:complete len:207 (-) Transcript_26548:96-716(-)
MYSSERSAENPWNWQAAKNGSTLPCADASMRPGSMCLMTAAAAYTRKSGPRASCSTSRRTTSAGGSQPLKASPEAAPGMATPPPPIQRAAACNREARLKPSPASPHKAACRRGSQRCSTHAKAPDSPQRMLSSTCGAHPSLQLNLLLLLLLPVLGPSPLPTCSAGHTHAPVAQPAILASTHTAATPARCSVRHRKWRSGVAGSRPS